MEMPMSERNDPNYLHNHYRLHELYPDLPTVKVENGPDGRGLLIALADDDEDPVFWLKADDTYSSASFFLAGYATRPRSGLAAMMVTVDEFMADECCDRFYYGLMVTPEVKQADWMGFNDLTIAAEGPGTYRLKIDESWTPQRFSEVIKQYPDYKIVTQEQDFEEEMNFRNRGMRL
jgi:hypothetical protein